VIKHVSILAHRGPLGAAGCRDPPRAGPAGCRDPPQASGAGCGDPPPVGTGGVTHRRPGRPGAAAG